MPLPSHLQRYHSLIDRLVEELVREMQELDVKTPAGHDSDGRDFSTADQQRDEHLTTAGATATAARHPPLR
jgi:hypothetical protein